MRIKKEDLERVLERLNEESIQKYGLHYAYGKVQLVRHHRNSSAISAVTGFHTKRELYYIICAILDYLRQESYEIILPSKKMGK